MVWRIYEICVAQCNNQPRNPEGSLSAKKPEKQTGPKQASTGSRVTEAKKMKEGIHPDYREVVFHDISCDFKFVTRSTIPARETIMHEGKEYPYIKVEVSSESHPFYTGKYKIVDTAGRVEKFRQKFGKVGSRTHVAG